MKFTMMTILGVMLLTGSALAQETAASAASPAPDCAARSAEKKLAGAALKSFMKKCERDAAQASCDVSAGEKKLRGAAKRSFVTKCVKDATAH